MTDDVPVHDDRFTPRWKGEGDIRHFLKRTGLCEFCAVQETCPHRDPRVVCCTRFKTDDVAMAKGARSP